MAEVSVKISAIDEASKTFQNISNNIGSMGEKMSAAGKKMSLYVTAPLTLLGGLAVKSAMQFEEGYATIARATGKTGQELEKLKEVMRDVNKKVVADVGVVASVIGELDTRLDLTSEQTEEFSEKMLKMAYLTKTDAVSATRLVTKTMHDWGIETHKMGEFLDEQFVLAQKSGISITELNTKMAQHGAQLRLLGFDQREAMALLAKWEKEGEDVNGMLMGMNMAIADLAREGIDPLSVGFEELIKQIQDAETETDAVRIAMGKLGARAGADFAEAVRGGAFAIDKYRQELEGASGAIIDTADDTKTFMDMIIELKKAVSTLMYEFGKVMKPILRDYIIPAIKDLTKWFKSLSEEQKTQVVIIGVVVAAIGPLLVALGFIAGAIKKVIGFFKGLWGIILFVKKVFMGFIAVVSAKLLAIPTLIGIIIGAIASAVVTIIENWDSIKWAVGRIIESIQGFFRKMIENVIRFFDPLIELIKWVFERIGKVVERAREIGGAIGGAAGRVVDVGRGAVQRVGEVGRGIFERVGDIGARGLEAIGLRQPQRITNVYVQGGNYLDKDAGRKFAEILAEEYNLRF